MSKLRRNNMFCSRNRSKATEIKDISTNGKFNLNKNQFMSTNEFFTRIQKSLYYGDRKLSIPLTDYIADSFSETQKNYSLSRLNYSTVGNLHATPCTLILALCYLERLKETDPAYSKRVTPTELFLVSMMVATKFYSGHDDEAPYVNWTECMNSDNLLEMELSFLNAIDWKVYVSREQFFEKVKALEIILARQQGSKRGFFTYMEMDSVMPSVDSVTQIIQASIVLSLSYTVFVASMIASVFLVSQLPCTCLHKPTQSTLIQSTVEIPSENSTTQQFINNINEKPTINTNLVEKLFDFDLTDYQMKKPNATTWIPMMFSSWYSLIPVINDNDDYMACTGLNRTNQLTFLSNSPINGIKMHWF